MRWIGLITLYRKSRTPFVAIRMTDFYVLRTRKSPLLCMLSFGYSQLKGFVYVPDPENPDSSVTLSGIFQV